MSALDRGVLDFVQAEIEDQILQRLGLPPRIPPAQLLELRESVFRDRELLSSVVLAVTVAAVADSPLVGSEERRAGAADLMRTVEVKAAKFLPRVLRHGELDALKQFAAQCASAVSKRHAPQTVTAELPAKLQQLRARRNRRT